MNLCEWYSNSLEFLRLLPADKVSLVEDDNVKVFGLSWDRTKDVINIAGMDKVPTDNIVTKRSVLNIVAKFLTHLVSLLRLLIWESDFTGTVEDR